MHRTRPGGRIAGWTAAMVSICVMPFSAFAQEQMTGFSPKSAQAQKQIEDKFKRIPSPEAARKQHRFFTAEPHPAGSECNNELARYVADTDRKSTRLNSSHEWI